VQHFLFGWHERNQQPAHSSIAIQKRVDRLELGMSQAGPYPCQ